VVPVSRQIRLARAIPGAVVHEVEADHAACVNRPEAFNQALLQACWSAAAAPPGIVAAEGAS
jgi:pimeloyl-ACP methyl ester carboxylesterase